MLDFVVYSLNVYFNLLFKVNSFLYYIRVGVGFVLFVVIAFVCVTAAVFLLLGRKNCSLIHIGL